MCEFNLVINKKTVFKDVVYAKAESGRVVVKDILGDSKEYEDYVITEVDVTSVRLVLSPQKA
jgi:predicted RNA-binding protein